MIQHAATRLFLALLLVAGASVPARAQIITFDGLAGTAMAGNQAVGTTFTRFAAHSPATVDGFQFTSSGPSFVLGAAYATACCNADLGPLAYNGTDYLIGLPDITVNRVGGGAFALRGFDLAEWDNTFTATISLTTAGPAGPTTEVLPLSIFGNRFKTVGDDFTRFSLEGYGNVVSFTLVGNVSWAFIAMDNLNVASPIPEPGTYALLLAGLGLLGVASRRGKQRKAAAT